MNFWRFEFSARRIWNLADLYRFDAHKLMGKLSFCDDCFRVAKNDGNWFFDDSNKKTVIFALESIAKIADELGMRLSKNAADLLIGGFNVPQNSPGATQALANALAQRFEELQRRVIEELESYNFHYLGDGSKYLGPFDKIFAKEIGDAFPKATEDLEEAAECLAFERPTANVFHLMRAMELAVQALYLKLGLINSPEREWGKLLSDIGSTVENMQKGQDRDAWSASHSHLYHVKQAWRNDVMHPKQTYTMEEANEVFWAVKSFMKHLSSLIL